MTNTSVLDDVWILRSLNPQLKAQLEKQLQRAVMNEGDLVFSQGDPGDAIYIIIDGLVAVTQSDEDVGLTVELATLGRGEAFGEMAIVTGEPRSATVKIAQDNTKLLRLSRDTFFQLLKAAPEVGLTVASTLAKRLETVNRQKRVAFGTLRGVDIADGVRQLIPSAIIRRQRIVPVKLEREIVTLATPNPENQLGLDEFRRILKGLEVKLMAVSDFDFDYFLRRNFPEESTRLEAVSRKDYSQLGQQVEFFGSAAVKDDPVQANQRDVVELFGTIVAEGVDRAASDIHIEPSRDGVRVRYRIDGRLQARPNNLSSGMGRPLVSRVKVLADLDIAERRLPQDGRISFAIGGRRYDLRVSTVATQYGEKVTLRILDANALQADLSALILANKIATVIRNLFYRPSGLVLVTGPTGSGKTTTLYAALLSRNNPELNICTIEDPIEYHLDDLNQVQVNEKIGLDFPTVMRSLLRQDPDIVLVGETRDSETAKLACNAALTGHLVLSSFHTNDALSAIQRMRAMHVEPFMISEALLGVVNQRLVRRVCPVCREETTVSPLVQQNLERANILLKTDVKFYRGVGCKTCEGDGFRGRVGVYELLVCGPEVKAGIADELGTQELRTIAEKTGGYVPLSTYATFLLNEGLTVPSEILRIVR